MSKLNSIIYLAGQISPEYRETYEWRTRFILALKDRKNIRIFDPCQTELDKTFLSNGEFIRSPLNNLFVPKDLDCVQQSNIIIFNMIQYDKNRPLIGTVFELSWAYLQPHTMKIGIYEDRNNIYKDHIFINKSIDCWCKNEIEASEIVSQIIHR